MRFPGSLISRRPLMALCAAAAMMTPPVYGQAASDPAPAAVTAVPPAPSGTGEVTFSRHIAPLVHAHCTGCHRPGQIGPFPLTDYASVKRKAREIAEVTADRVMPPWHADPGAVAYTNDRSLKAEEIRLFQEWAAAGAPEGDPALTPPMPDFPEGWQLGKPDLVATMPEPFTVPAEGRDIYRKFVMPLNRDADTWVKAIEFRPGEPRVVHHILYYLDTTGKAREYDARDPKPGFGGMRQSNGEFRYIGGWDVGTQPAELPHGLRWFIPKGSDLVVQIHYHPDGREAVDQSSVGFHFADEPTSRPWSIVPVPPHFGMMQGISIPPGEKDYVQKTSFTLPQDCEAFSVNAHAHYLGKRFRMTAFFPDGTSEPLLRISHWNFRWQEDYAFPRPVKLPAGTRLEVEMSYDNSADNPANPSHPPRRVVWGPATTDEMGSVTLAVMFDRQEQKEGMHQGLRAFLANQIIDRLIEGHEGIAAIVGHAAPNSREKAAKGLEAARQPLMALDLNKDGKLSPLERIPALQYILNGPFMKEMGPIGFD